MYQQLKEKLDTLFIYGPISKDEAFSVAVPHWATEFGGQWYVGTDVEVAVMTDKLLVEQ